MVETDGFTFCIEKELLDKTGGVDIDLSYMGFTIEPRQPLAAEGGSSCSSCGSGGSCSI